MMTHLSIRSICSTFKWKQFILEGRFKLIYLDHAATSPVHEEVLDFMYNIEKEQFGNPSSIHAYGRKSKYYLEEARRYLANSIHAKEQEIIFTSGGTEA